MLKQSVKCHFTPAVANEVHNVSLVRLKIEYYPNLKTQTYQKVAGWGTIIVYEFYHDSNEVAVHFTTLNFGF